MMVAITDKKQKKPMESKYKILVVDDDEKILDLIEDILLTSNFSFEIKKAKSEEEAYEAIKNLNLT